LRPQHHKTTLCYLRKLEKKILVIFIVYSLTNTFFDFLENTFSSSKGKREQKSVGYLNSLKDELREVQVNKIKQQKKEEENQPMFSFRSEVDNSLILPTKKKPIEKV
jgi:hypothetical protein